MSFYHKVNEEKSYRRAIFLFVSLAVAGLCSVKPVGCFKNYSSKERNKLNSKVAVLDQHLKDAEDDVAHGHRPRWRDRSHSPPRRAHVPQHQRGHRRHSSARPSSRRDDRRSRARHREDDEDSYRAKDSYHMEGSRNANDRDLDRERRERYHGHAPPRKYHHSS
ncbi:hypothetical protein LTR08_003272 [Meristemomyces frigidus]|nr:hypothetical protein LTR08_003272 [Meristemomyces frigidus]